MLIFFLSFFFSVFIFVPCHSLTLLFFVPSSLQTHKATWGFAAFSVPLLNVLGHCISDAFSWQLKWESVFRLTALLDTIMLLQNPLGGQSSEVDPKWSYFFSSLGTMRGNGSILVKNNSPTVNAWKPSSCDCLHMGKCWSFLCDQWNVFSTDYIFYWTWTQ